MSGKFLSYIDPLFANKTAHRIFMGGFIFLCLLHLFSQRPLWLDENFVYQNIIQSTSVQLFGPLDTSQAFPRVHLCMVKWFSFLFDNHVVALRFFSFVFMTAAFLVWKRIYFSQIKENQTLVGLLLFSWVSSYWLVYYSAELKPYSMDVLTVGLYTLFFYFQNQFKDQAPSRLLWISSAFIPFLIFFSYASIFVLWIGVYNFLHLAFRNKKLIGVLILHGFISLVCLILFYWFDIRHSSSGTMSNYWESYFLCTESAKCFFGTFGEGVKRYAVFWWGTQKFFRRAAVIFIPLFLYGLVRWGAGSFKKENFKIVSLESLSFVLFIEFIILGLLHKYPFTGQRITLFYAPFVFYLIIKTLIEARRIKFLGNILYSYYIVFCCASLTVSTWMYARLYQ
ncbi:MAG: hypothetical protein KBD53_02575 [Candidatus Omnitrophica bacterium]|nr:hypothetical protein [Candidatus Omnitrophota bacterium]